MNSNGAGAEELLVIGIGNAGRGDDGLGWAFLDRLQEAGDFAGPCEYRYQLQVEDAELVSRAAQVVFVDACQQTLSRGFELRGCQPRRNFEFSTHALAPEAVLQLCASLYGRAPQAEVLAIEGREWDLGADLSAAARRHLRDALQFFRERVLAARAGQSSAVCQE